MCLSLNIDRKFPISRGIFMASCNSILMFWKHFAFIYVFSLSKVGNEGEGGQSKPTAKLANTVEGALVDVELSRIQSLYAKLT